MSDAVLVGLISATATIIVQLIVGAQRGKELNSRIERLERKVDEHNGYARRFGEIEKTLVAMQKDLEYGLRNGSRRIEE